MQARSIVVGFDVGEQVPFGVRAAGIGLIDIEFSLHGAEEALNLLSLEPLKSGSRDRRLNRQRYRGKDCDARADDMTDPSFAGQPRPLRTWVLGLYVMGLNRSNRQIAPELALRVSEVQVMTEPLRSGLVVKLPPVTLDGDVEVDEVYGGAGHKGNPSAVAKKATPDGAAGSKEPPAGVPGRRRRHRASA